jgi:hypothetical protein
MITTATETTGTVWVLRYSHRHGDDLLAFTSTDLAHDALAAICREWWDDITWNDDVPETPDGMTDEAIIETYFDHQSDEFYAIEHLAIFGTAGDVSALVGKDG